MRTIAFDVLEWLDDHPEATSEQKCSLLGQVPMWQWAMPDGHWGELKNHCQNRVAPGPERRPGNALNIEIGTPMPRCLYQSPDGRGLAWYMSGGSALDYGHCTQSKCPRCKPDFYDDEEPAHA